MSGAAAGAFTFAVTFELVAKDGAVSLAQQSDRCCEQDLGLAGAWLAEKDAVLPPRMINRTRQDPVVSLLQKPLVLTQAAHYVLVYRTLKGLQGIQSFHGPGL